MNKIKKYWVIETNQNGEEKYTSEKMTIQNAEKTALEWAKNAKGNIFVQCLTTQCDCYLNPNGDHSPLGKTWAKYNSKQAQGVKL
jgi:hypothetical protein